MSNRYSLGGYKIALQARSSKTLLVEGKDDKELFDALKITHQSDGHLVVDTQDIFKDGKLFGLGAKAKIDFLIGEVHEDSAIKEKLTCFVDREWEELIDSGSLDSVPWSEPLMTDIRLKTAGHSIENYGFTIDFVRTYLKHFGRGIATLNLLTQVLEAVPELLRVGAAFSEVARKRSLMSKCSNLLDLSDIDWHNGKVLISHKIEQKLIDRGAQNVNGFFDEFSLKLDEKWRVAPFSEEAHLHAHGHIGEMILWLGVGKILLHNGLADEIGQEVANGRRDEKRRVWHSWLCTLTPDAINPLCRAFSQKLPERKWKAQ